MKIGMSEAELLSFLSGKPYAHLTNENTLVILWKGKKGTVRRNGSSSHVSQSEFRFFFDSEGTLTNWIGSGTVTGRSAGGFQ